MQAQMTSHATNMSNEAEYITIVAPTLNQAMQQFRDSNLAAQGFCITGRVARHKFSYAGDAKETELFDGVRMIAATFMRMATKS